MGAKGNAYRVLVGKTEAERQLERFRHKWKNNIKVDFKETVWEGVDCIKLAQDEGSSWAAMNMVMNIHVPTKMWGIS
jgi:hypothetical protein